MTETAKHFPEVLEFCNKVREAGGAKPLDALLPGIPMDAQSCLIANNLNFQCFVHNIEPSDSVDEEILEAHEDYQACDGYIWGMHIADVETRDKIAKALDLPVCEGNHYIAPSTTLPPGSPLEVGTNIMPAILLPAFMGSTAAQFDEAWNEYDEDEENLDYLPKSVLKYVAFFAKESDSNKEV